MRALLLVTWLVVAGRSLLAQCPDGSPPPCRPSRTSTPALDPNRIAVLPFRVAGADSAYAEGVAELVAAEFTGEGGPRAADMGTVLRAWQRAGGGARMPLPQTAAARLALQIGAGQLLTGSVVGVRGRLTLTALVVRVPDGQELARPLPVQGPEDSLPELLRRLSANLLAGAAPGAVGSRSDAGTSSPQALRAYIAGRAAYRRGRYVEAATHFARAVDADSGYVLAAFAQSQTSSWGVNIAKIERFREIAWRGRDRLGGRDRALLEAELGSRYPGPTPSVEWLAARERAVATAPDSPEAWYYLGDLYFHWGGVLDFPDTRRRSAAALERSVALDSTAGVLGHLLELAVLEHDTARGRSLWQANRRFASGSDHVRVLQWLTASLLTDTALLRRAHAEADSMKVLQLQHVAHELQYAGLAADEVDTALSFVERRSSTQAERRGFVHSSVAAAVNAGRPSRAMEMLRRLDAQEGPVIGDSWRVSLTLGGWGGDSADAARAAARLVPTVEGPVPEDSLRREHYYAAVCSLARWRLEAGDVREVSRAIESLRIASRSPTAGWARRCADLLAAMAETAGASGFDGAVARFDSVHRSRPWDSDGHSSLALARAYAARGDVASALAAGRRQTFRQGIPPYWLAALLREEGRLAALTGDTAGAVRAYRHYLTLRPDPEPSLVPQRDSVRAELGRLEGRR